MATKITNYDLRKNKYDMKVLEENIDNLDFNTILNTQILDADFCAKYILNEDYMTCFEETYYLSYGTVLYKQPHITEKELDEAFRKLEQVTDGK